MTGWIACFNADKSEVTLRRTTADDLFFPKVAPTKVAALAALKKSVEKTVGHFNQELLREQRLLHMVERKQMSINN